MRALMTGMKWDDLPRPTAAEHNARIENSKMTTQRWLWAVLVLVIAAFFLEGNLKIAVCAITVGGLLLDLAFVHWAKPAAPDDSG
jgi:hypothetical protein